MSGWFSYINRNYNCIRLVLVRSGFIYFNLIINNNNRYFYRWYIYFYSNKRFLLYIGYNNSSNDNCTCNTGNYTCTRHNM